ncbi:immunity protein 21 of polymorphic toxin system [Micromonospora violae]|uniref:Immunity protein 21 of polymorphic toxin system n=1 Tax=Micromonospora violae TaxID=1278207 RepID=A0A4V2FPN8_9ACTN|nr:immunity protein 21 of polymorphic toxin system [Micromonospora violae]
MDDVGWIESAGGPFVALSASELQYWTGSSGSDYDDACEVDDYLGLLRWGQGARRGIALVVGDEPLPTTFLPDIGCLLQWQYAPSDADLIAAARSAFDAGLRWEEGPIYEFADRLVLIDAAATAESLDRNEMLDLPLVPGRYQCSSAGFSEGGEVAGRLHRFSRL